MRGRNLRLYHVLLLEEGRCERRKPVRVSVKGGGSTQHHEEGICPKGELRMTGRLGESGLLGELPEAELLAAGPNEAGLLHAKMFEVGFVDAELLVAGLNEVGLRCVELFEVGLVDAVQPIGQNVCDKLTFRG